MINAGFLILAGSALKAFFALLSDDGALKLPYCIVIAGFVCTLFAVGIPHLSALGVWLGVSTFFTLVYTVITCFLTLQDEAQGSNQMLACIHNGSHTRKMELEIFKGIQI